MSGKQTSAPHCCQRYRNYLETKHRKLQTSWLWVFLLDVNKVKMTAGNANNLKVTHNNKPTWLTVGCYSNTWAMLNREQEKIPTAVWARWTLNNLNWKCYRAAAPGSTRNQMKATAVTQEYQKVNAGLLQNPCYYGGKKSPVSQLNSIQTILPHQILFTNPVSSWNPTMHTKLAFFFLTSDKLLGSFMVKNH